MRTIILIDGQNLFHLAKRAWGSRRPNRSSRYDWPSYDVETLANALVTNTPGRKLAEIRFYTGVPDPKRGPRQAFWHRFWSNKLRYLRRRGIHIYRGRVSPHGEEKGVDVCLAIDLIRATYEKRYECSIIVSQDKDFGPAIDLAKTIAREQMRRLTLESAFPVGAANSSKRGIPGTKWVHIDKSTYDACFDPTDYRPKTR